MRTVFVIGAGANVEIGMPSGELLKRRIADVLDFNPQEDGMYKGDEILYYAINLQCRQNDYVNTTMLDNFVDAAKNISKSMSLSSSIDNFIESRKLEPKIMSCGKLAIVKSILVAEHDCALPLDYDHPISRIDEVFEKEKESKINKSWYSPLFQKIVEGCQINQLAKRLDDISFIIFNYDRCFEYFMYNSLKTYYNLKHDAAKSFVENLHINHPYGTVGDLWDDKDRLTFGIIPDAEQLLSLSNRIKTFSERARDSESILNNRIQYLVERADRVVFLGFAYHDQNLDMLFKHQGKLYAADGIGLTDSFECYGTGYGIAKNDLNYLCDTLQEKYKRIKYIDISPVKCSEFFKEFWYRLSFKS